MRIGVDVSPLKEPLTGVGTYIYYLLEELIALHPHDTFYLYSTRAHPLLTRFLGFPHVKLRLNSFLSLSEALWSQTTLAALCYQDRLQVFWGPTQSLPLFHRASQKNLLTVHDFAFRLYPQTVSWGRRFYLRTCFKKIVGSADKIGAISQGTANRLEELYKRKADEIISPPLKKGLKPKTQEEVAATLQKFDLQYKDFVLMVGTLEPRKNFAAITALYKKQADLLPLVIVGAPGWGKSRETVSQVKRLGYTSDSHLLDLLAAARYLFMPSLYEGYGIPLAEARTCGTEVVCTEVPEMIEAAQGDCHLLSFQNLGEGALPLLKKVSYQGKQSSASYLSNQHLAQKLSKVIKDLFSP